MQLSDVKDFVRQFGIGENFHIGRLNNKKDKSVGIYGRAASGGPVIAIGGIENSSYGILRVNLLIHWNHNSRESEAAARALYDCLIGVAHVDIGQKHIQYLRLQVPEPVPVGTDENGVYEYVILFDVYYRR